MSLIFEKLDLDRNGKISRVEYDAGFALLNGHRGAVRQAQAQEVPSRAFFFAAIETPSFVRGAAAAARASARNGR